MKRTHSLAGRGLRILAGVAAIVAASCAWAAGAPPITAGQMAEAQQRFALAREIVARLAPDAARLGLAPEWQRATLTLLLASNSSTLASIAASGGTYEQVIARASNRTGAVQKSLGDPNGDLTFIPFTPCRYIDTRNIGGKISGIRTFDLANNGGSYGGSAGCDPKTLASASSEDQIGAIAFNIAYVDTSAAGAPGFLTVRPAGSTQLTAMLNWYVANASAQDSNSAVSALNQAGPDEIEILSSGSVHVILDLLGAFVTPFATALDCVTVQSTNAGKAQPPGATDNFGVTCTAGYQVTGGGCSYSNTDGTNATENTVFLNKCSRSFDTNTSQYLNAWFGQWTNNDPVKSFRFIVRAMCCRTPGR